MCACWLTKYSVGKIRSFDLTQEFFFTEHSRLNVYFSTLLFKYFPLLPGVNAMVMRANVWWALDRGWRTGWFVGVSITLEEPIVRSASPSTTTGPGQEQRRKTSTNVKVTLLSDLKHAVLPQHFILGWSWLSLTHTVIQWIQWTEHHQGRLPVLASSCLRLVDLKPTGTSERCMFWLMRWAGRTIAE